MAAKRSKSKTALRGAVNNIIMESLYGGEKYGYEIIKEVEEKTNGKIKLKQPSLYSSLKRFEAKGYIESYWQDSDIGGKRHYYKLTPAGTTYYRKHVAKEDFDDDLDIDDENILTNEIEEDELENMEGFKLSEVEEEEYLEDKISEYEIDTHEESSDLSKYEYNVEDKINSLLNESSQDEILNELYSERDEETILYSEEDLIQDQTLEVVADHDFKGTTPLVDKVELNKSEITDNALNDIMTEEESNGDIFNDITLTSKEKTETKTEKVKIITDENGITKMYYDQPITKTSNNKIFDNVVYRTNSQDIYSSINKRRQEVKEEVLTDEEKELKSKRFFEKFDSKSEQIMRDKQLARANEPRKEEPVNNKIDYDYKLKLNNLFNTMTEDDEDDYIEDTYSVNQFSEEEEDNNYNTAFEEEEEYTFNSYDAFNNDEDDEEEQESIFVEKDTDYTVKVYTEEKVKDPTIKYLQVNKAKFTFGLTMLIFMLIQTTVMLLVFKNNNLLMGNQFWVFQLSYIIIGLVALIYCVPVFISPNKQSSSTFKLSYSLMFGCLSFFIIVILTYAVNTFLGMELFNITYYLATLIVPIATSLNFIFGPLIYWLITQNKKFY